MNWMLHYDRVIDHYRKNPPEGSAYCEVHHVLPRSFGGSDDDSNLVRLPVKAHIHVHLLLFKHWKDRAWATMDGEDIAKAGAMALALDRLRNGTERQQKSRFSFSSKIFAEAKEQGHEALKHMIWINDGKENTMVDSRNPNCVPDGWVLGMIYHENRRGRIWATNGKRDLHLSAGQQIPPGFWRGRVGGNSASKKMWITDGSESRYILKTDPIPEGWARGRGSKFSKSCSVNKFGKIHEINGKLYNTGEAVKMLGISTGRQAGSTTTGKTVSRLRRYTTSRSQV